MNNDLKLELGFIIEDLFDLWTRTKDEEIAQGIKEIYDRLQKFNNLIIKEE